MPSKSSLRSGLIASLIGIGAVLLAWSVGYQLFALWHGFLFNWPVFDWTPFPHFYIAVPVAITFLIASVNASDAFERRILLSIAAAASIAAIANLILPLIPRTLGTVAYIAIYASQDFALFQLMRWAWICIRLEGETTGLSLRRALTIVATASLAAIALGAAHDWLSIIPSDNADNADNLAPLPHRLSIALLLDPANPGLRLQRALARQDSHEYERAIADFSKLTRLDPYFMFAMVGRAYSYEQLHEYDQALQDCNAVLAIEPDYVDALIIRARVKYKTDHPDEAIADWTKIIAVRSDDPRAYAGRAMAYAKRRDFTNALADANSVVALNPSSGAYLRGLIHLRANDYEAALNDFDQVIKLSPKDAYAYWEHGRTLNYLGDPAGAISDYQKAIDLGLRRAGLYSNKASAEREAGNDRQALSDYSEALKIDPQYYAAFSNRGYLELSAGNYDAAISDFKASIALNAKSSYSYNNLGSALFAKGDSAAAHANIKTAMALEREALKKNPNDQQALNGLAWLLATSPDASVRNGAEAVSLATQLCELSHWKNLSYLDTLAAAYAESGQFDQAVEWQKKSLGPTPAKDWVERLALYEHHQPYREK